MKVGIVGAGAMGCLFGGFLARELQEVWLVDIWKDHVNQINEEGLCVRIKEKCEAIIIKATTNPKDVGACDLVVISTKYDSTQDAVKDALAMISDETVVVTLQNGLGNLDIIAEFVDEEKIVYGVTTLGSILKGPGIIEATVTDEGKTYLWPLKGEPNGKIRNAIDTFNHAGLNFILSPDVKERIWKKLCLNAGLSVPLAIFRLNCGDYIKQSHALELTRCLVSEIVTVAAMEGVKLDPELIYQEIVELAKKAPDHRTSALLDILNHRKTEIDVINGAILNKAKQNNISIPYNSVVYSIIKVLENTYDYRIEDL